MSLRITRITIENYKRIKLIEVGLDPNGNLIIISGANASGKTSLLDGIENTLNGTRNAPAIPVRIGAKKAKVALQLGDQKEPNQFTVRRVTDAVTRRSSLIVTAADGREYSSPQAFLDALLGPLSFDPLAFARKDPRKQAEQLRELVGIDFTELDKGLAIQQEERTAAGREVKRIKGSLDSMAYHSDVREKISIQALTAELDSRQKHNAENEHCRDASRRALSESSQVLADYKDAETREQMARDELEHAVKETEVTKQLYLRASKTARNIEKKADSLVDKDLDEVRRHINQADEQNEKWRENGRYLQTRQKLQDAQEKHGNIKAAIEVHTEAREEMLASAKFPIEGLGFDEHGVTYCGVPFSQASAAQQLRVSLSIVLNMNPGIAVVLIRDGSLLDKKSRHIVATMVKEAGAQCLMECTDDEGGGECRIVIEDGSIKEQES